MALGIKTIATDVHLHHLAQDQSASRIIDQAFDPTFKDAWRLLRVSDINLAALNGVNPATSSSSTSLSKPSPQINICRERAMSTMLMANAPERRMLTIVSFCSPVRRG